MKNSNIPSLSIALVDTDNIVWAQGFGFEDFSNTTPATAITNYPIASISKLLTASGVHIENKF